MHVWLVQPGLLVVQARTKDASLGVIRFSGFFLLGDHMLTLEVPFVPFRNPDLWVIEQCYWWAPCPFVSCSVKSLASLALVLFLGKGSTVSQTLVTGYRGSWAKDCASHSEVTLGGSSLLVILTAALVPNGRPQCKLAHSLVKAWMVPGVSWRFFSHETQCYEHFCKEDSEMKPQEWL